jgi:hypothetical protein
LTSGLQGVETGGIAARDLAVTLAVLSPSPHGLQRTNTSSAVNLHER